MTENFDCLKRNVCSNAIEVQIPAIEEAANVTKELANLSVAALRNCSNPFLVAERLHRFGSIVIEPLKKVLDTANNSEEQILASLVLLQLDSRYGVQRLLQSIEDGDDCSGLAAMHLAKHGITDAISKIIDQLRLCDIEKADLITSFIGALEKFNIPLPSDLQERFTGPDVPRKIRWFIETPKRPPSSRSSGRKEA